VAAEAGTIVAPGERSHRRLSVLLVLGALSMLGPLALDGYLPALPALGRDLGASTSATQATLSGCLIGLALGQLLVGPLSDAFGRRRPLLAGILVYFTASLLCAIAPTVWLLISMRVVQGLGGAAGVVIARAIVRDLFSGVEAAQFYGMLLVMTAIAPVVAPFVGAQLLRVVSWRGIFYGLAGAGALIAIAVVSILPETLSRSRRHRGGFQAMLPAFRTMVSDRAFVTCVVAVGLASGAVFAYLAGSPFVLQNVYGMSPQLFSISVGCNALGIMGSGFATRQLVHRFGARRLLLFGLSACAAGGAVLLASVLLDVGLVGVIPSLFVTVAAIGLVGPNAMSLALTNYPQLAGSASALIGMSQFATGALATPLVGLGGSHTAVPMACTVCGFAFVGLAQFLLLTPRTLKDNVDATLVEPPGGILS
jgi:DHA1 family bicyclomycin/chloramphenicol resistance-like MFS transporter